ncbi:protein-glutamate O-methyltransferase CheR [Siminovitchia fortis]|uniref:protein-glutamate O-methyltransferase n=1 Tax=Siminovitchia fortis TaxID=254758 RepID=A0A443IJD3_9BACI|nr:protein-glutamate O-methyltransferase CheR [Siminovitchia fortis]RWR04703.1 protein-glutamate O-methyltransferase CheR [Siminovitchia fortis]WHY83516.1 protein-glutamate O-methyltransferase CheR [Siminovitchia fortis]
MLEVLDKNQDYDLFIQRIKRQTNIDLHAYKEDQMKRRLTSLKSRKGFRTFDDFYKAMMQDEMLYEEFLNHMTINVTEFFRNPSRWNILEKKIIPELLEDKKRIKCWSAACSTGEEPYSLAMLLSSFLDWKDIRILATDINQKVIDQAKSGVFNTGTLKNLSPQYREKFFADQGRQHVISEEVRKSVHFKQQNLLSDPFEQGFDLIICRNVLIYFTDEAKDYLFHKFSRALNKGGYLFVGGSEQIFQPQRYQLKDADTFFYKKM